MKNLKIYGIKSDAGNCFSVLFLITFIFTLSSNAQELPPVLSFSPQDYQADNQNWSITQSDDKHIFIANNKGLLEYEGEAWTLYPSPNQSILRSVFYHDDKIYTGSYREFGFWEKQDTGKLTYKSLSSEIIDSIGTDEQFWTIDRLENWIIFQSLDNLYVYHILNEDIKKITIDGSITKMYKLGSDLYFQIINKGLFKLKDGKAVLVSDHELFQNQIIINIYERNAQILIQTDTKGIYSLEDNPVQWPNSSSEINQFTVYTSLQTNDGSIVLGTISEGVVFVNADGKIQQKISQKETLNNNTVLSVFEDKDDNIWLGLDNGINCININSPVSVYHDDNGSLGTVYTSLIFEDQLFVGTNQGLFKRPLNTPNTDFELIEGSEGQVWTLKEVDGDLLCGHNNGSYLYSDGVLKQFSNLPGTWCFKPIPNRPDLLLQGNYRGLSIIENTAKGWRLKSELKNFDVSSKFVEFISDREVLIDHEYKGVYRVVIDDSLTEVADVFKYQYLNKGLYSSLVKFKGEVYYAQEEGISKFNSSTKDFVKDTLLSKMYTDESYFSGKLVVTEGEIGLWSFNKNSLNYTLEDKINTNFRLASIPITSNSRTTMIGYENVYHLGNKRYLIGSTQGYMIVDFKKFTNTELDRPLKLNSIFSWVNGKQPRSVALDTTPEFRNKENNISFNFSVPYYEKYFASEYQYRLKGFLDNWSSWDSKHEVEFNNLPFGDYEFQVRAHIGELYETDVQSYEFTIARPFAFSNLMLFIYFILFIMLSFLIHTTYRRYYKKQKLELQLQANREIELKELESQKEIMQIKNDKLKQDIDSKSRELAVSTMSLIKKNEFLGSIKEELQKSKPVQPNAKKVIKIIDKNINNTDDWKMFEEAFNNSDKDFLKTMKAKHPSLTPNDLRLCAYLRLNLSSKEIAPLFNISTKSVEVKRYRLRKKMDLPREISLTDYILEI